jgi:hypothetical protein
MSRPRGCEEALERVVYVGRVNGRPEADREGPTVAVVELDLRSLLRIVEGTDATLEEEDGEERVVAETDVAWTELPSEYRGLPYEALRIVYDAAVQWRQLVWADDGVLAGFGALPARRSSCTLQGHEYVWRTVHPDAGELWTDPLSTFDIYPATMFLGTPFHVRATAETLATHYPELLANALLADVRPRFGVAHQGITRRDIRGMVGYEELRPMLSHESERVRRAASEALERGPRLVS